MEAPTLPNEKEKLRLLVKNLPNGYAYHQVVVDHNGIPVDSFYLDVNTAFEKITGLSKAEVIGKRATEIYSSVQGKDFNWIGECSRLALTGDSHSFEHFSHSAQRWYSVTVYSDEPGFFVTLFDDITGTKHMQDQKRFEQVFRHNPTLMALSSLPERRFLEINNAFLETLGFTRQEIIGKTSAELGLFAHPEQATAIAERLKSKGQVSDIEMQARCKDGTILDGIFSGEVFSSEGKQYFLTSMLNITARKKAEKAVMDAYEVMLTVLNSIDAFVYVADLETYEILFINQYGKDLWGNIVGEKCWAVLQQQPAPCNFCTNEMLLDTFGTPTGVYNWELQNRINGRWYDCRDTAMRWYDGRMVRLQIATDITERKLKEEKILLISFHDRLTGLYNRSYLEEEMKRLDTDRQLPISIVMADLNGLKLINDTLGHSSGDGMLRRVAELLKYSCREEDIVTRWGGDEFLIFLPQTDNKAAVEICKKIKENCRNAYYKQMPISISLGAATKNNPGTDLLEVLGAAESNMYKQKLHYSQNAKSFVLDTLLMTLRAKSNETEEHNHTMRQISRLIGRRIGLSGPELSRLDLLISIHDIGKVNISEEILTRAGPLTPGEWEIIRSHPAAGYRIARATEGLARVAEEILSHHEHWDGSGYPQGLQGKVIPLLSRIAAIADAFEVMTGGRPHKKAVSQEEAIGELKEKAGKQFDPELVAVLLNSFEAGTELGCRQES